MKRSENRRHNYRITFKDAVYGECVTVVGAEKPVLKNGFFFFGDDYIIKAEPVSAIVKENQDGINLKTDSGV